MRVVLIGGTGFIGQHVIRWLVEAGAEVVAIHRGRTPLHVAGARSLAADRTHVPALAAALTAAAPAVVVDMTAYTAADAETLLRALPAGLGRLVLISSGDVYHAYGAYLGLTPPLPGNGPHDERAPLRSRLYPYRAQAVGRDDLLHGYDKIVVERTARRGAAVPVTVLRLPMVYGPHDRQRRVPGYLERFQASGDSLRLNPAEAAWRCTRGYVEDVAWAIRLAALDERAAGEVFNVGEVEALSELEWARAIAAAADWHGRIVSDAGTPASRPLAWENSLIADSGRIRQMLGYREPVGRTEGLRRTVAAERIAG